MTYPVRFIYATFLRLFKNPHPAITLKDPELKYALRLIDKEVSACTVLSMISMDTVKSLWHLKSWVMLQQGKYLYFKERTSF